MASNHNNVHLSVFSCDYYFDFQTHKNLYGRLGVYTLEYNEVLKGLEKKWCQQVSSIRCKLSQTKICFNITETKLINWKGLEFVKKVNIFSH